MAKRAKKPIVGLRPVRWTRVTNPFAAPGSYASRSDKHGPAGHHTGVDFGSHILAPFKPVEGQPVRAAFDGTVVISDFNSTMGNWVGIYNAAENVTITYWHMKDRNGWTIGRHIKQGAIVGHVGETGNAFGAHLHVQANAGRGFFYSGHIHPGRWISGSRWWTAFDRRRRAGRKTRKVSALYEVTPLRMVDGIGQAPRGAQPIEHPSAYDGRGSDVPDAPEPD